MAVIDGARRSATCAALGRARVAVMSRALYERTVAEASPLGVALRRILLSSLSQQLSRTTGMLEELLAPRDEPLSEEETQEQVLQIAGVLGGWKVDTSGVDEVDFVEDKRRREKGPR